MTESCARGGAHAYIVDHMPGSDGDRQRPGRGGRMSGIFTLSRTPTTVPAIRNRPVGWRQPQRCPARARGDSLGGVRPRSRQRDAIPIGWSGLVVVDSRSVQPPIDLDQISRVQPTALIPENDSLAERSCDSGSSQTADPRHAQGQHRATSLRQTTCDRWLLEFDPQVFARTDLMVVRPGATSPSSWLSASPSCTSSRSSIVDNDLLCRQAGQLYREC